MGRDTLERYENQPLGTRKRDLYQMEEMVMALLNTTNEVLINRGVWVLEFTSEQS
jgi:hypothetical protein